MSLHCFGFIIHLDLDKFSLVNPGMERGMRGLQRLQKVKKNQLGRCLLARMTMLTLWQGLFNTNGIDGSFIVLKSHFVIIVVYS